jgi:hypothetical protein
MHTAADAVYRAYRVYRAVFENDKIEIRGLSAVVVLGDKGLQAGSLVILATESYGDFFARLSLIFPSICLSSRSFSR